MGMTPWVRRLLIANVVVFFVTQSSPQLQLNLAFIPVLTGRFGLLSRPWTPLTYMFVHGGFMHILFNMLMLYFFGPRLEARMGSKNFVLLYLVSGLGGAALTFAFGPLAPMVGASGAIFGVSLGFAMFWPTERIYIWGIFPVQARVLIIAMTVLSLYAGVSGARDGIAHFGHLGGFAGGFLFLKWVEYRSPARRFKRQIYAHVAPSPTKDPDHLRRWKQVNRDALHEINRAEYDRLMAKIDSAGINSLTLDERAFLDRCCA